MEIALRYLVFRRLSEDDLQGIGDVGEFLTDKMTKLAEDKNLDRTKEGELFRNLFAFLNQNVGQDACRKYAPERAKFTGGFSVSAFEVVALGMGFWMPQNIDVSLLNQKIMAIWENPTFIAESGSGISASRRIPKTVKLGREVFKA